MQTRYSQKGKEKQRKRTKKETALSPFFLCSPLIEDDVGMLLLCLRMDGNLNALTLIHGVTEAIKKSTFLFIYFFLAFFYPHKPLKSSLKKLTKLQVLLRLWAAQSIY